MRSQILKSHAALLLVVMLLGVGCAKKNSVTLVTPVDGGGRDVGVPVTPGSDTGGGSATSVPLEIDSVDALEYYVLTHPINNPSDVRVKINLYDVGGNRYAGAVKISYVDNGQLFTGNFGTDNKSVVHDGQTSSNGHQGKSFAEYNKWFNKDNKSVFHGSYSDNYGAIMVIVDTSVDQGDGGGASEIGGEIWFKNYPIVQAQKSQLPCWFIELGPYDCRTFLMNDTSVVTTSALYPSQSQYYTSGKDHPYQPNEPARGWRRLGRFSGLSKSAAFGL